ncbi:hypothetical protein KY290_021190 [Solanum tuberosum]|uniref:DUF4283 domain-containing protein n=1 Tax=Solanum tuberosum TaxID=4113 RepID=A0ABQ7V0V3_SOLTU|nr:hypothetical protein KY285_020120 [Solanum tuberosum]KAH0757697.1 hypothetical protein KY290_021190 [Solanum tuberosum]
MAFVPAMEVPRPPDQDGEQHNGEIHLLQQTSLSNSHHNSTNLESNTAITIPLSDDELKWAQEIISLVKSRVIRIVPIDGMNSTPHNPSIVVKSHNSLLPTERSAQANFEKNSPKSPQNSNEDLSELSAPNHININYVNEGKNSDQDSDQVVGAQLNELTNANTHIHLPEGGVITSTTSQQSSSMNRLNTPSKAAGKSVMSMDRTANNPQGEEQSARGNKNADNSIEGRGTVVITIKYPMISMENKRDKKMHDNNKPTNLLNSENQNMHEKGSHNVQVDGNEQLMANINKGIITIDPRIPPPIKVSSNFDTYKSSHPKTNQFSPKKNQNRPTPNSFGNNNTNSQIPKPSPPTVVQSLAIRLRANQAKNTISVIINPPIMASRQGRPSVTFYEDDFMINMAARCKYTLVGKYINDMPKMEVIRRSFSAQTHLTGGVKIAHFNSRHIYIDFDNEADHVTVWTKQKMFIAGHQMKLQMWSPGPSKGKWQLVEYEEVPPYCLYCKQQGHIAGTCPLKIREEEIKKRKDMENNKKSDEKQNNQGKKKTSSNRRRKTKYSKKTNKKRGSK